MNSIQMPAFQYFNKLTAPTQSPSQGLLPARPANPTIPGVTPLPRVGESPSPTRPLPGLIQPTSPAPTGSSPITISPIGGSPAGMPNTPAAGSSWPAVPDNYLWAEPNPYMQEFWSNMANISRNPMPLEAMGSGMLGQTMQGDYLDPSKNPALQNVISTMFERELAPRMSEFSRYGAYGGSDYNNMLRELAEGVGASVYLPERQNMMNAASMALPYSQFALGREALLGDVGKDIYGMEMSRRQEPWTRLGMMHNLMTGMPYGGTSVTTTQGPEQSWAQSLLGGGLLGLGTYGMMSANPALAPYALPVALGAGFLSQF